MANMDKLVEGTGKFLASSQGRKALETAGSVAAAGALTAGEAVAGAVVAAAPIVLPVAGAIAVGAGVGWLVSKLFD